MSFRTLRLPVQAIMGCHDKLTVHPLGPPTQKAMATLQCDQQYRRRGKPYCPSEHWGTYLVGHMLHLSRGVD